MLQNQFDLIPITEFFVDKYNGSHVLFVTVTVSLGILIVILALCIVGRRVYKSLHKKHMNQYHKMKTQKKAHKNAKGTC